MKYWCGPDLQWVNSEQRDAYDSLLWLLCPHDGETGRGRTHAIISAIVATALEFHGVEIPIFDHTPRLEGNIQRMKECIAARLDESSVEWEWRCDAVIVLGSKK